MSLRAPRVALAAVVLVLAAVAGGSRQAHAAGTATVTGYGSMESRFAPGRRFRRAGRASVLLKGARNEFVSFQVAVTANTTITAPISLSVSSPLSNTLNSADQIPAANWTFYSEYEHNITQASDQEGGVGSGPGQRR